MTRISLYEQKEISWGFYRKQGSRRILVNILPYADNTSIEGVAPDARIEYNGSAYSLEIGNHTHPGLWGKTYGGKWIFGKGGGTQPSDQDYFNAPKASMSNLIWSRYGITNYDKDGIIDRPSYSNGLLKNYWDNNTVLDINYIQKTLKWKKSFSTPPMH